MGSTCRISTGSDFRRVRSVRFLPVGCPGGWFRVGVVRVQGRLFRTNTSLPVARPCASELCRVSLRHMIQTPKRLFLVASWVCVGARVKKELLLRVRYQLLVVCLIVCRGWATTGLHHSPDALDARRVSSAAVLEIRVVGVDCGVAVCVMQVAVDLGGGGLLGSLDRSLSRGIKSASKIVPSLLNVHDSGIQAAVARPFLALDILRVEQGHCCVVSGRVFAIKGRCLRLPRELARRISFAYD